MSRTRRMFRSRSGTEAGNGDARDESPPASFRPRLLPVVVAVALGLGGGALVAREIARAQTIGAHSTRPAPAATAATSASVAPGARAGQLSGQSY